MHHHVQDNDLYELSATLLSASKDINKFLSIQGRPNLSFSEPARELPLSAVNAPYYVAKCAILEAAERIVDLVKSPRDKVIDISFQHCATASLQVIQRYGMAQQIPLGGSISYAKIAENLGGNVTQALVERVLQHAMSFGLFRETASREVAHNETSALLITDPDLESWLYLNTCVAYPAGAAIPKAIDAYGVSSEANESAYGMSIGRKVSQFQRFREPDGHELHELFAKAMRGISAGGAYDVQHAVDGYPWQDLGESLIVDVGGGPGHVSVALANKYPQLGFEVQDLPETVAVGAKSCPDELRSRISFESHDFFMAQPDRNLSDRRPITYFARFILHDWSDKYACLILQALAQKLRPQDTIVLNEVVVPKPGEMSREYERRLHDRDLLMLMNLNGRERSENAFSELFASVSPGLKLAKVHRPSMGELSLIEVKLASENDGDGAIRQTAPSDGTEINGHLGNDRVSAIGPVAIPEEAAKSEGIVV